jgi:D-aspartate ligase
MNGRMRKLTTRKRILITSASTDPGLSILRELYEAGYDVIGADWRTLPFGLRSRYLGSIHRLPDPADSDFDHCLIELIKTERPDAFLPLLETKIVASACRRAMNLQDLTATNIPDHSAFEAAFNKFLCSAECKTLGIPCPEIYSPKAARHILANGKGQAIIIVKPGTDQGMARGVEFVRDVERLAQSISNCRRQFGNAIIQEFIPGDVSHMHTAIVLFDRNTELIAAFTMQKLRQWPPTGGVTGLGVSTNEFHLVENLLPFFQKWRWCGPAEVELKLDPRDGLFKVIEINPRFPGYMRFPMICGMSFALLSASLVLGDKPVSPVKYPSYSVGKRYANPGFFLRSCFADIKAASDKFGRCKQALKELSCLGPVFNSMANDPLPMVGRLLNHVYRPSLR